jgi:hypothetical protein
LRTICCSEADLWLNDPEVRKALHAAPLELTGPWTVCSDRISYTADAGSMLPLHKQLTRKRGACRLFLLLHLTVFVGVRDACVLAALGLQHELCVALQDVRICLCSSCGDAVLHRH